MEKRRILLIASRPLANDGLTKIERDVIYANISSIDFEVGCCFGFENDFGKQLISNNIPCHTFPNKKRPFAYMAAISKLIKSEGYDAVYIHGNSAMMFLEAVPAKIAGAKVITHCHNTRSDFPFVHYVIKPFFNLFVDKKIGCSIFASKWAYCGKNIITIPNGIEIEKFAFNEQMRGKVREELGWKGKKIVGHIGRFNRQKNHSKLIGIFDEMHKINEDMRLLLVGDGELLDDIKNEITARQLSDYTKIIGFTDRPQDYIQAMDVMIMPSLYEGLCLVAVEAQANGLPVLIDDFFSPETSVTEQAKKIDLSLSDLEWAKYGIQLIKKGRKNVTGQIINKKMNQSDMLEAIRKILTT